MIPRFRFAPSPTGEPHVGSLHTALFSWALARHLDGDFILRIDDTDTNRNSQPMVQAMIEALQWLGVDWDEGPDIGGEFGPYYQSQRVARHVEVANELVARGAAYWGDGSESAESSNQPLTLKMPKSGQVIVKDGLRGEIVFDSAQLKDTIIMRSDGSALYHLASAVDDHDMGITHAVRGEDWISSAPIQVVLYEAMGWQQPIWIHKPFILNKHRQKLSKRDPEGGYLARDFQQAGYLPQALFNYLLLLGWSPDGTDEIVSKWTVRKQFRLERLSPSASIFDWDKLNWVNQQYIKKLGDERLAEQFKPFLEDAYGYLPISDQWLIDLTHTIRDNVNRLDEVVDVSEWAFDPPPDGTAEAQAALQSEAAGPVLAQLAAELAMLVLVDQDSAESILKGLRKRMKSEYGWSAKLVYHPIRAALTGDVHGPPLNHVLALLGKQRSLERVAAALKTRGS